MTHRYTVLVGGTVLPSQDGRSATAIAWAEGVVLAVGTDEQVRGVSRGDSHVIDLHGAFVVPASGTIEIGDPADLEVLIDDPRAAPKASHPAMAQIRGGHVVSGSLHGPPERPSGG